MDKTIERLEALFTEFRWGRLVFWLVLILLLFAVGLVVETTTGVRFLWSMDRKVQLLTQLQELASEGIAQDPQLGPIYQDSVRELAEYKVEPLRISLVLDLEGTIKFLGAALPVMLFYVATWFGDTFDPIRERIKRRSKYTPLAIVVMALVWLTMLLGCAVYGIIGLVIPTLGSAWVNAVAYFVVGSALMTWGYIDLLRNDKSNKDPFGEEPPVPSA